MTERLGAPIIIENGQYWSKNGFSPEEVPRSVFHTLISFHKGPTPMGDIDQYVREYNIGEDALKGSPERYRLGHAIGPRGILEDLAALEKIWHYTFYTNLRVDPSEHSIILMQDAGWPAPDVATLADILFGTFDVPCLAILTSQFGGAIAAGLLTALVVDIGHTKTTCLPVMNCVPNSKCRGYSPLGGKVIDERILVALEEQGVRDTRIDVLEETVQLVKRDYCYLSDGNDPTNPEVRERGEKEGKEVTLPNNIHLQLGAVPHLAPRVLVEGGVLGESSLVDLIAVTIANCPEEARGPLRQNILLCGGTANIPGLGQVLESRLNQLVDFDVKGDYKVTCPPKPEFACWRGGSIAGGKLALQGMFTTRREYKDGGPSAIHLADKFIATHFPD